MWETRLFHADRHMFMVIIYFTYYAQVQHNVKHTIHIQKYYKILKFMVTKSIPNRAMC